MAPHQQSRRDYFESLCQFYVMTIRQTLYLVHKFDDIEQNGYWRRMGERTLSPCIMEINLFSRSILARWLRLTLIALPMLLVGRADAAPYHPANPAIVLERLPSGIAAKRAEWQRLRRGSARDIHGALQLADSYLALGRKEADPRFYAYAQAVLAPWARQPAPPPEIVLRRATIRQFFHDFDGALADLQSLEAAGYDDPQVDLLAASILRLRGDYAAAIPYCQNLLAQPNQLAALTCAAELQGLGGDPAPAIATLQRAITFEKTKPLGDLATPALLAWSQLVLANLYERSGKAPQAGHWYMLALSAMPAGPDAYALGAYADFLLDQNRAQEVMQRLDGRQSSDGLLLRLAIACQRRLPRGCSPQRSAQLTAELAARFAAVRARGERPHQGEEARYWLELAHRPDLAFRLAAANWQTMKEPRDAMTLAQSALATGAATGKPEAPAKALALLQQPALHDTRLLHLEANLRALAQRAGGLP